MADEDRNLLVKILEAVARLETEVKAIKSVSDTANEARDIAKEAMQSTKSAHHRLDTVDKQINELKENLTKTDKESINKWEKVWEKAFWVIVGAAFSYFVYKGSGH